MSVLVFRCTIATLALMVLVFVPSGVSAQAPSNYRQALLCTARMSLAAALMEMGGSTRLRDRIQREAERNFDFALKYGRRNGRSEQTIRAELRKLIVRNRPRYRNADNFTNDLHRCARRGP
jgi:hypothetical protein